MNYKTILLLLLIVGCRAKKEVVSTEKVVIQKSVLLPSSNQLEITTLCDSITGLPIDFKTVVTDGVSKATIQVKDNKLTADIKNDSIVYVDKLVEKERLETITKIDKQWDFVLYALAIGFIIGITFKLWFPLLRGLLPI